MTYNFEVQSNGSVNISEDDWYRVTLFGASAVRVVDDDTFEIVDKTGGKHQFDFNIRELKDGVITNVTNGFEIDSAPVLGSTIQDVTKEIAAVFPNEGGGSSTPMRFGYAGQDDNITQVRSAEFNGNNFTLNNIGELSIFTQDGDKVTETFKDADRAYLYTRNGVDHVSQIYAGQDVSDGAYAYLQANDKYIKVTEQSILISTGSGDINLNNVPTDEEKTTWNEKQPAGDYAVKIAGKIQSADLPSYVDDVIEVTNFAALPATGATGIIYVALDTNYEYRWSGSTYIRLVSSPGTTDDVAEGSVNKYWTNARSIASVLTSYLKSVTNRALTAADSILTAISILEKKADDNATAISNKADKPSVSVSSATTLSLATNIETYVFSGSADAVWTLPAVTGNTGVKYLMKNRGSVIVMLTAPGTDKLYNASQSSTQQINPGEAFIIQNDGSFWIVM